MQAQATAPHRPLTVHTLLLDRLIDELEQADRLVWKERANIPDELRGGISDALQCALMMCDINEGRFFGDDHP